MAHKTRKAKKKSDSRRPVEVLNNLKTEPTKDTVTTTSSNKVKATPKTQRIFKAQYSETPYDRDLRSYTVKDSIKTIVITGILVVIQVGIYVAAQQGLLDTILRK